MTSTSPQQIAAWLSQILLPGQVTELRALNATAAADRFPQTWSGYFDDVARLASEAQRIKSATGIYFLPNPVNSALLARASNRVRPAKKNPLTGDTDVIARRWLLIDADAVRPAGISATDAEHAAAQELISEVSDALSRDGWPRPIIADSGNGGHALYRIDLAADDDGLVKRCLEALAGRFDTTEVKLDRTVFNQARIWKLYGTLACKGDSTADRPHRMSRIIESPPVLEVVSYDKLDQLSKGIAIASATGGPGPNQFDLEGWIARSGLQLRGPEPWRDGQRWVFRLCPWNSDHTNESAFLIRHANGAIAAGCHHNGCSGMGWHDLRDVLEPGWRDSRQLTNGQTKSASSRPPSITGGAINSPAVQGGDSEPAIVLDDPWPDPISPQAFHGLAGEIARVIEPHTEADPIAVLFQILVGFGNLIGRHAYFLAEADRHYANLFGVLVGRTSKGRKGTSWGQAAAPLAIADPLWRETRVLGGLSSGEGLIWAVRDPITKRTPIYDGKGRDKRIVGHEDVVVDAGVDDKRLMVLESEFGSVLRVVARERNTLSAIIRQAWDVGNLRTLTKNSPAAATGAHISIIGHITRDELRRQICDTDLANGLANRFLWLCVERSKCLPEGGHLQEVDLESLSARLAAAAEFARTVGCVRRDAEARTVWCSVYGALSAGRPGLLGAATSRAEAQTMRLALIYALLDCSTLVRKEHLLAALAMWEFAEGSARYCFGSALGDPTADEILRVLRGREDGMTRSEIREHFQRHKGADEVARALGVLLEHRLARRERREATGGRPAEVWFAMGT